MAVFPSRGKQRRRLSLFREALRWWQRRVCDGETVRSQLWCTVAEGRPIDEIAAALSRKNVPFAFATGYGRKALPQTFQEAIILQKPFNHDEVLAVIEVLLYLRHQDSDVIPLKRKRVELSAR
jgi:hypothetical protein